MNTRYSIGDNLTLEQAHMLSLMNEHSSERNEGWTTHLIKMWFPVSRLEAPTILGSFAWVQTSTKTKWVKHDHAFNIGGGIVTESDIARDYLHCKYGNDDRYVTSQQHERVVQKWRSAPLMAYPCRLDEAVYMDLKSAYWQIVLSVGWDVDYNPDGWLSSKSNNADFPVPDIKMARNCLVSLGLPFSVRMWDDGKLRFFKKSNKFINLVLWALAQDVLNGVAFELARAGAVYAHTDGYIIPADKEALAYEIAESWGLLIKPKHRGAAVVRNVGNYDIGDRKTKLNHVKPRQHFKVNPPNISFLKPRFRMWAERNNNMLT